MSLPHCHHEVTLARIERSEKGARCASLLMHKRSRKTIYGTTCLIESGRTVVLLQVMNTTQLDRSRGFRIEKESENKNEDTEKSNGSELQKTCLNGTY
jgi:hypothetical protein